MNPELQRLERALRAAHAAGDEAAAQQFAQAIRRLQAAVPAGQFGGSGAFAGTLESGAGGEWTDTPRQAGRAFAAERGVAGAAVQGLGSAVFGLGTPVAAADEMVRSRLGGEPRTWAESLEFARGLREGSYEEHPNAYRLGFVGGLATSIKGLTKAAHRAPTAVRDVFMLAEGQTKRNIARLAAQGAATAGVTAGMQEGPDAIGGAATIGGIAGPVLAGAARGVVGGARKAQSFINPDHAAIRLLRKKTGESADVLAAAWNHFRNTMGRAPRLIEIMQQKGAEELGQVGRLKSGAAQVFRDAEEEALAVRPGELRRSVERGGASTTVAEQEAGLVPIVDEAQQAVGILGARPTVRSQIHARNRTMDEAMDVIGEHQLPVSGPMIATLESPDLQRSLSAANREQLNQALERIADGQAHTMPLRLFETIRRSLGKASKNEIGSTFSDLRNEVRDYAAGHIPEYASALEEFGLRTVTAKTTSAARNSALASAHELADLIRVGEGKANETAGAAVQARARGATYALRAWVAKQLGSTTQEANRLLSRLTRDNQLRTNLRATLSPAEMRHLEDLADMYGHQLNMVEGAKVGAKVLTSEADQFRDAVRAAAENPGGEEGVRASARRVVASAVSEGPVESVAAAKKLANSSELRRRLTAALGGTEAARLQEMGVLSTRAARNLAASAPRTTAAQTLAQEQAAEIQELIGATIIATPPHRFSAAFLMNQILRGVQHLRLSKGVAKRLAEMAVDPDRADVFIRRMRAQGVSDAQLLQWYRDAALAAGITTGASTQ